MAHAYTDQDAIDAALRGNWRTAIQINTELLKNDSKNIDVLNRLGFGYLKTRQIKRAREAYQKVLNLDPYNQIALKNSKTLAVLKRKNMTEDRTSPVSPLHFLEDPGKTKIASCVNVAPTQILSTLSPGMEVYLKAKNHCVEVRSEKNLYLAALPDDISFKLIKLLSAGNTYQVIVKGIGKNALTVILRETKRGKRFARQPSFISSTGSYLPFFRADASHADKPDVTPTGEDEETPSETTDTE